VKGDGEMCVNEFVGCEAFPCADVNHKSYIIPDIDVKPEDISIVLISEAAPANPNDFYYAKGEPLFQQTTVQAFNDAGANVSSIQDIVDLGVYLTTAVKCGKTGYGIRAGSIKECSFILEKELAQFPNVKVYMLMGDVAIKALNYIAKRTGDARVIPAGSTYKIRGQKYYYRAKRAFPSYLQAGPSFNIEKSKRRMIAEDIVSALSLVEESTNLYRKKHVE
jgi:uracil-DNA glycosylase